MSIITEIFSWWGGNTWSNRIYTRARGRLVGRDEMGNLYYEQKKGVGPLGRPRRWVIYKKLAEASFIPPGWHGWMHYATDVTPTQEAYRARPWEREHKPNLTGTAGAYRPPGSIVTNATRPKATGDYEPWKPE